jgi:hypothetical protein
MFGRVKVTILSITIGLDHRMKNYFPIIIERFILSISAQPVHVIKMVDG